MRMAKSIIHNKDFPFSSSFWFFRFVLIKALMRTVQSTNSPSAEVPNVGTASVPRVT